MIHRRGAENAEKTYKNLCELGVSAVNSTGKVKFVGQPGDDPQHSGLRCAFPVARRPTGGQQVCRNHQEQVSLLRVSGILAWIVALVHLGEVIYDSPSS